MRKYHQKPPISVALFFGLQWRAKEWAI